MTITPVKDHVYLCSAFWTGYRQRGSKTAVVYGIGLLANGTLVFNHVDAATKTSLQNTIVEYAKDNEIAKFISHEDFFKLVKEAKYLWA